MQVQRLLLVILKCKRKRDNCLVVFLVFFRIYLTLLKGDVCVPCLVF